MEREYQRSWDFDRVVWGNGEAISSIGRRGSAIAEEVGEVVAFTARSDFCGDRKVAAIG